MNTLPDPRPHCSPIKVIVVDDSFEVRKTIVSFFSGDPKIKVVVAGSSKHACELARNTRFDVIVQDVWMKESCTDSSDELPGRKIAELLVSSPLNRRTPVLMLTKAVSIPLVRRHAGRAKNYYKNDRVYWTSKDFGMLGLRDSILNLAA